jgi:hypothetical protein
MPMVLGAMGAAVGMVVGYLAAMKCSQAHGTQLRAATGHFGRALHRD